MAQEPVFITNYVRNHTIRRQNYGQWQTQNFAVVYYSTPRRDGTTEFSAISGFNEGNRGYHTEELLFQNLESNTTLRLQGWTPLAVFTERQPCSKCNSSMSTVIRAKARGHTVRVYYISPYPPTNVAAIINWW